MASKMNGPCGMYKISPQYNLPKSIEKPKCMYDVKSIYYSDSPVIKKSDPIQGPGDDLGKLEDRQKRLIHQIEELTLRLQQIKQQMTMVPPAEKTSSVKVIPEVHLQDGSVIDVVATAPPSHKPIALLVLANWLKERYWTSVSIYTHSSVTNQQSHQKSIFHKVTRDEPRSQHQILITLIWKEDVIGNDPWLTVSSPRQAAIAGDVNILRYLASLLAPHYHFTDAVRQTEVDAWLDLAHSSLLHGTNAERQSVLQALESHLGKANFLVGNVLSIADVGMLGALLQTQSAKSLPTAVKRWLALCGQNAGIAAALNAVSLQLPS